MAGKLPVFGSRALFYAMDQLSKNTLIDLVTDLARGEIGEGAIDEAVLAWVQRKIEPTHRAREQAPVDLLGRYRRIHDGSDAYRKEHEKMVKDGRRLDHNTCGMYGLWSMARNGWMPDPMSDDDPPPPLRFDGVMDAITAAANYHFSFHALPVRFAENDEPNKQDMKDFTDV